MSKNCPVLVVGSMDMCLFARRFEGSQVKCDCEGPLTLPHLA
jgi:hypothetical protein